jgi:hypothetical protein
MVRFWLINFLRVRFVVAAIIVSGCVSNPKYETADAQHQKELEQNPQFKQQINNYEADKQKQLLYETLYKNTDSHLPSYQISPSGREGWSVGDPSTVLQIGNVTQYYRHKINLILVCNRNSFYPTRPRIKQLNWKISEKNFGTASMSAIGEVNIYFTDEQNTPYTTIEISTDKKTYKFPLNQNLTVEFDKTDC